MLRFMDESHRDMSSVHWYKSGVSSADFFSQISVMRVGDCTVHHGWTLHDAPPQNNSLSRLAIGFTYVIGDATVLGDFDSKTPSRYSQFKDEDEYSYRDWLKDLKEGDVIDHPLLPLVYRGLKIFPPRKYSRRGSHTPQKYIYESF